MALDWCASVASTLERGTRNTAIEVYTLLVYICTMLVYTHITLDWLSLTLLRTYVYAAPFIHLNLLIRIMFMLLHTYTAPYYTVNCIYAAHTYIYSDQFLSITLNETLNVFALGLEWKVLMKDHHTYVKDHHMLGIA